MGVRLDCNVMQNHVGHLSNVAVSKAQELALRILRNRKSVV